MADKEIRQERQTGPDKGDRARHFPMQAAPAGNTWGKNAYSLYACIHAASFKGCECRQHMGGLRLHSMRHLKALLLRHPTHSLCVPLDGWLHSVHPPPSQGPLRPVGPQATSSTPRRCRVGSRASSRPCRCGASTAAGPSTRSTLSRHVTILATLTRVQSDRRPGRARPGRPGLVRLMRGPLIAQ